MNNIPPRERRVWYLFLTIIFVGVVLMLFAGQFALRVPRVWSMAADMRSKLTPNYSQKRLVVAPVGTGILRDDRPYSTPGTGTPVDYSSDIILQPNGSATFTVRPPATATSTVRVVPTSTRTLPPTNTGTARPTIIYTQSLLTSTRTPTRTPTRATNTATRTVTATVTRVVTFTATKTATAVPPVPTATFTPTATATMIASSTATSTPSATATATVPTSTHTPTATFTATPTVTFTPTATAVPTFAPRGTELNPVPVDINIGPPNGPFGFIQDGYYAIMDLTSSPIVVTYPPDANYDFVYYEQPFPVDIQMDTIVMGISVDGINFYEVFNWSNDIPDYNSNIWNVAVAIGAELDNQLIAAGNLYGTAPYQAGILIDVDNAPSYPPAGSYRYLILEAPAGSGLDPGTDVDAIQIIEVSLPP